MGTLSPGRSDGHSGSSAFACEGVAFATDRVSDLREESEHVIVGEAHRANAEGSEDCVAALIVVLVRIVDFAVHLDGQPRGGAIEVGEKSGNDVLASELEATERAPAHCAPKHPLRFRLFPSHLARQLQLRGCCPAPHLANTITAPSSPHALPSAKDSRKLRKIVRTGALRAGRISGLWIGRARAGAKPVLVLVLEADFASVLAQRACGGHMLPAVVLQHPAGVRTGARVHGHWRARVTGRARRRCHA